MKNLIKTLAIEIVSIIIIIIIIKTQLSLNCQ